jgi:protein-tyrosine phosphatase
MKKLLFVCLGNICRSPLAHGIAQDYVEKNQLDIEVDSCGTGSWHLGETPCSNSIKIAKQHGIDISHQRARQIKSIDFEKFDLIIGLDDKNIEDLLHLGCPATKLKKLGSYGWNDEDIPDPYFFDGFDGFEQVYRMIEGCTVNLFEEI